MTFTVRDYHDLVQLLTEHPEWQWELRRLLISEDLQALPGIVRDLAEAQQRTEAQVAALAEAQRRAEERLSGVEERLSGVEERLSRLEETVAALAEAQRRAEERLSGVEERLSRLEETVAALAEAQRRTDERLAAFQQRTDERFAELAEAQRRTDERLAAFQQRTDERFAELAEAQRRTDERLAAFQQRTDERFAELAEAQRRTERALKRLSRQVGGLSDTVGGDIEDIAYIVLHDVLRREFGWQVGVLERTWQRWDGRPEEVNVFGQASDPARPERVIWIVGEAKHNLTAKEVDRFIGQVERARRHLKGEVFAVCFCYRARPEVQQRVRDAGLRMVFSYGKLV